MGESWGRRQGGGTFIFSGVALSRRPWSHPQFSVPEAAHKKSGKGSLSLSTLAQAGP